MSRIQVRFLMIFILCLTGAVRRISAANYGSVSSAGKKTWTFGVEGSVSRQRIFLDGNPTVNETSFSRTTTGSGALISSSTFSRNGDYLNSQRLVSAGSTETIAGQWPQTMSDLDEIVFSMAYGVTNALDVAVIGGVYRPQLRIREEMVVITTGPIFGDVFSDSSDHPFPSNLKERGIIGGAATWEFLFNNPIHIAISAHYRARLKSTTRTTSSGSFRDDPGPGYTFQSFSVESTKVTYESYVYDLSMGVSYPVNNRFEPYAVASYVDGRTKWTFQNHFKVDSMSFVSPTNRGIVSQSVSVGDSKITAKFRPDKNIRGTLGFLIPIRSEDSSVRFGGVDISVSFLSERVYRLGAFVRR